MYYFQYHSLKFDLVKKENSDFKYTISSFPDGQHNITIDTDQLPLHSIDTQVTIHSRFNSFVDLEIITCAVYALRKLGYKNLQLYCPYILGARSDRMFSKGSTRYLKDVVAPVINNLNFSSVIVVDPHSDVMENVIDNFEKIDNVNLVQFALKHIYGDYENCKDQITLVSPDAGAEKKIYNVAEKVGLTDLLFTSKHRDLKSGKITNIEIHGLEKIPQNQDLIIIDDIGDGFGTFIYLAKAIREIHKKGNLYLVVTHSIQRSGLEKASELFNDIFTTNSVNDWNNLKNVTVMEVF